MHPMLNIAIQAARSASKILVQFFDHLDRLEVNEKNPNDLVTQADLLAEQEIISIIRKSYPDHSILSEEAGKQEGNECCWIIDPLDGTANFVHGFPQFAISIAMQHRNQLEVALVYDPLSQEMFTASRGQGAQLNQRRIRVSNTKKLTKSLIGTGFPFREQAHLQPFLTTFQNVLPQAQGVRRAGAAALDLAYVAAGRLDGFWEAALKPWDMAAGALLIKEAGGLLSDFTGEQNYLQTGNIIAGSPRVFKELSQIVQESLRI
ncbi:MAG: inositol monophosphatase [Gammaproteobacteria bacterium]|nr:inositol monophosphatase [Gammaproteobacteria bacterium]